MGRWLSSFVMLCAVQLIVCSFSDVVLWFHQVRAVTYDGSPVAHLKLYLFKAESLFPDHVDVLETDKKGVAQFSLDTDRFRGNVLLKVRLQIFWPK